MPPLSQAYVQRMYRPIGSAFVVLVLCMLGGIVYTGWARTTITVTPLLKPVAATFDVTVGPGASQDSHALTGAVTTTPVTTTVTATPGTSTATVPAHAHGTVTFHNDSTHPQPLATGTRLQSIAGVIVRTQKRLDLAPRSTTTADVTADPLGNSGEVPAGRFTIVALWPGLQTSIYATSDTALTGGMTQANGGLSLDRLTAATDAAQKQIEDQVGKSTAGVARLYQPVSVSTDPPAETPSDSYRVTVNMKAVTITYPADQLMNQAKAALQENLADGTHLATMVTPTVTLGDFQDAQTITLHVAVHGQVALSSTNPLLAANQYRNLDRQGVTTKLLGSNMIKSVSVAFAPGWRSSTGTDASRIAIVLRPGRP